MNQADQRNTTTNVFDRIQKKKAVSVIVSSPYTERLAAAAISFDREFGRIGENYARGQVDHLTFNKVGERAQNIVKMLESEIMNMRNMAKPRSRQNRPKQKPPRVHTIQPIAKAEGAIAAPQPSSAPTNTGAVDGAAATSAAAATPASAGVEKKGAKKAKAVNRSKAAAA